MEAREAVRVAKRYVADIFSDETISEIGLDEIEFSEGANQWRITIGFRRPFSPHPQETPAWRPKLLTEHNYVSERWYRIVTIDDLSGEVLSMKALELDGAA